MKTGVEELVEAGGQPGEEELSGKEIAEQQDGPEDKHHIGGEV
jgi:hypothetical protein